MAEMIVKTAAELRAERGHLLQLAGGMSEDELRQRAANYLTTAREMDIIAAIDDIDFLLGDD